MRDLSRYSRVTPGPRQAKKVAAKLPYLRPDAASVRRAALDAGMKARGEDVYGARDGSWVALVDGRVERGAGRKVWDSIPQPAPEKPPLRTRMNPRELAFRVLDRLDSPPRCMRDEFIGHGDITRAYAEAEGQLDRVERWVGATRGAVTQNAAHWLESRGVQVPRHRRADR